MKPAKMYVPQSVPELLDFLGSMLRSAPKFLDKAGWLPFLNSDYVLRQLNEGLSVYRAAPGEDHYHQLMVMLDRMQALFEADPNNRTGETMQRCRIIHQIEDILTEARRKS